MDNLINIDTLLQLGTGALLVVALVIVYYSNKSKDTAMATVLQTSIGTVSSIMQSSIATLEKAQEGQRLFYQAKVDDLFKELISERQERKQEVSALQKRITDLECEVKEKDERIANQEDKITELEAEVLRLRGLLNGKQDKAGKGKKDAAKK
jgi:peptidoglycan hydrolase CwlO-like protein